MNFTKFTLALSCLLFTFFTQPLLAQSCNDAPITFTIIPDGISGNCFLQINWAAGDMPEIACGSPGSANGTLTGTLFELAITVNGVNELLYDRGTGSSCNNFTSNIAYSSEANAYVTTISNANFCLAGAVIAIEGNRSGSSSFECLDVPNSDVPAPAELLYFKGEQTERGNILKWATASEENVASFSVEKSDNGRRNFQVVGSTAAAGFSNTMEYYELEDTNPLPLTYYRLRTLDYDGSEMFSDWVAVERKKGEGQNRLEAFPSPLGKEDLQVYYQADSDEQIIITVSDIRGSILYKERVALEAGMHHWNIELPAKAQGLLVLRIHHKDGMYSQMIPRITEN